jgi:putative SOS response-associated peptidase YedK
MCQRYVLPEQLAAEREFLPAVAWWRFAPRYNVALTQFVPAVRLHSGQTEGVMLRWGLIPAWVEGASTGWHTRSVHAERMDRSTSCRGAWQQGQRCILPLAGFYVWKLTDGQYRQPFFVRLRDRSVFGVAAVWDHWVGEDDDVIDSCAMITVPANELLATLSGPRLGMPAILRRRDYAAWLSGTPAAARAALSPYRDEWMTTYPVSPLVNSPTADDPRLIQQAG